MATLTAVTFHPSNHSSATAAALIGDYARFNRQRAGRQPYVRLFVSFAALIMLGAALGRLPGTQSEIVAALCLAPPLVLWMIDAWEWHRLVGRLEDLRQTTPRVRKS